MLKHTALLWVALATASLLPHHAVAQKNNDTLRVAIHDMFGAMDPYNFPHDEGGYYYRTIYSNLLNFDEYKQQFVPSLAKSYRRVSDTVLEFDLREDVTFHNGNKFDADDVVATLDWLGDERTKIRFKDRYDWAKGEKLGPYKIRLTARYPFSTDLISVAYRIKTLDAETMRSLQQMSDYGRFQPNGTGVYKVVDFNATRGLLVEAVTDYWDKSGYQRAPARRVHGIPVADRQTQIAKLLAGELEVLTNVNPEDAKQLGERGFAITPTPAANLLYVTLDAAGRSANKAMADERVRKAFIMSLDRELITNNFVPGAEVAERPLSICFKSTVACKPTTAPYSYNPAEAKKLLAEAGYPNGVDMTLYVYAPVRQLGEAIAGEARKVGLRMTVEPVTLAVFAKKRGDGEFTAFVSLFPLAAMPDTSTMLDFFFSGDRDYWRDPLVTDALAKGHKEFDLAKRTAIYTPALDRINSGAYILPVSELPLVFAHSKNVKILRNKLSAAESRLGDYAWADYQEK